MANQKVKTVPLSKDRFREARKLRKMSLVALSETTGIDRTEKTLRRWIRRGEIPPDLLDSIGKALDVDPKFISGELDRIAEGMENEPKKLSALKAQFHASDFPYVYKQKRELKPLQYVIDLLIDNDVDPKELEKLPQTELVKLFLELEKATHAIILKYFKPHQSSLHKSHWHQTTIESILTNEKYKGAALLQKCYTVDFLTKKRVINEGQVPQYYIEHSHKPIIPPDEFEEVQAELTRRRKLGRRYSGNTIFSAKLICGDCGSYFGAKVWHSTSKYRRIIWQCNHKFKGKSFCTTPHLYEEEIKQRFVKAFGAFFEKRDEVLAVCKRLVQELSDTSAIEEQIKAAATEMNAIAEQIREHIHKTAMTEENGDAQYKALTEQFKKAEEKRKRLQKLLDDQISRVDTMNSFLKKIESTEKITTFDDDLWRVSVESVTVYGDGNMLFRFMDGREITA